MRCLKWYTNCYRATRTFLVSTFCTYCLLLKLLAESFLTFVLETVTAKLTLVLTSEVIKKKKKKNMQDLTFYREKAVIFNRVVFSETRCNYFVSLPGS